MPRVLYFSRDYTPHDHRFLSALAHTEYQVGYLRLEKGGSELEDRPLPPEIEQIGWAGGQTPAHLSDGLRFLNSLKQVFHQFKPDLVQAGPIQTAAFLVALSGFQPLVSTSWGYDLLIDAGRSYGWRWATRYTLARSAVLVGDCETIRQSAIGYGMRPDRIVTFPWGVDLRHFSPGEETELRQHLGWDAADFVLISTRGWAQIYGVEELARAFVAAARRHPELRLLMLGNGPQAALLRQIFLQGGVLEQVHFPGLIRWAELPRYYRAADLYLSASHSDGSSISLLEAMACGRPVLVSDIPGNQEWVRPGEQGWLFKDGDPQKLAAGILHAVESRPELPEIGRRARQTAEERADWDKNFPHLLEAYHLALKR
jgi:glycosyltransferase involved in cell wall biosynthesis